jgi:hypothetical protein
MGDILRDTIAAIVAKITFPYPEVAPFVKSFTNVGQVFFGSQGGSTGVTIDVTTPGNPRAVLTFNISAAHFAIKITGMAGAFAGKLTGAPALTYADNLITLGTNKFTIGTDGDQNTTGETIVFMAII